MNTARKSASTTRIQRILTPRAEEMALQLMKGEQVAPAVTELRVSVLPGGCSGFKYSRDIEERPLDDDHVLLMDRVRVFVDGFSLQYLNGVTVDYVTSMQGSGFTFSNPNATGGCGCGTSFTA